METRDRSSSKKWASIAIFIALYLLLNILAPSFFHRSYLLGIDLFLFASALAGFAGAILLSLRMSIKDIKQIPFLSCLKSMLFASPRMIQIDKSLENVVLSPKSQHFIANIHPLTALVTTSNGLIKIFSPGFYLLPRGTVLLGYFSLGKLNIQLGPSGVNPFARFNSSYETNDEYRQRLEQRHQTQAFSIDGVEIVPNIDISIQIGIKPKRVRVEIPLDNSFEVCNLTPLIVKQAANHLLDVFRQQFSQMNFYDIFSAEFDSDPIGQMENKIKSTTINVELPFDTINTKDTISITILDLSIHNLRLKTEIEEKLVDLWGKRSLEGLKHKNGNESRRREFYDKQFARHAYIQLANTIASKVPAPPPGKNDSSDFISQLISASLDAINRDDDTASHEILNQINVIRDQLERLF